ncbi:MAG: alpha-glucan family phosphorylase [Nevskia sp.]|nr:alpha-glucan family phosphorylase [Nevskia sp.]
MEVGTPFGRPLPAGLEALAEIAVNLHWTWNHASDRLWERLAPEIWLNTRNPWLILQTVSQRRLESAAADAAFRAEVDRVARELHEHHTAPAWLQTRGGDQLPLTAYFCMEYALAEALPLYSGGLGVLAGDYLKAASELGLPMVAVGLLYQEGYFRQMLDADGAQRELYPANAPDTLPIVAARDADGAWLSVPLHLPGRTLRLRVWRAQVGRVPLLLLDCNDPLNSPADRGITGKLYDAEPETRFVQELVLGIGGWAALGALGYRPQICHLNEGHAALVTLARARAFMQEHKLDFWEALWATRAGNVFTTHTAVDAAFDRYPMDLLVRYGREFARELGVEEQALAGLGRRDPCDSSEPFNMAYLAMRTCGQVNAVSRLHRTVTHQLMQPLYPRWPRVQVPVGHITNGVHAPSWDSQWADELWTASCGKGRWRSALSELKEAVEALDDKTLWTFKARERQDLVQQARLRLRRQLGQRGADPAEIAAAAQVLDPNALTLGFARRFTAYKRPNLLLTDPERLARLLTDPHRPVQLIVAGKAHPQDAEGKRMVREWAAFCQRPDLRSHAVFLEDYDLALAQLLVQGVDLWINTPRRFWEACGTSGMKVLVNGGLNLSTVDGWWAEAYTPEVGWAIGDGRTAHDAKNDLLDALRLYELLEREVVPQFYTRDAAGIPRQWVARLRASLASLAPRFSTNRMLREYLEQLYRPAAAACQRRCADGGRLAVELRRWEATLRSRWHEVRFGNVEQRRDGDGWLFHAQVYLGEIAPQAVAVELYADPLPGEEPVVQRMERGAPIEGAQNAFLYQVRLAGTRPAEDYTPRIVPDHAEARVPLECELIHWWQRPA